MAYFFYTLLHLGGALAHNSATLLSCRLLSGVFGSARSLQYPLFPFPVLTFLLALALTNSGGALSDFWNFRERGLATAIYATAPFLGPVVSHVIGGPARTIADCVTDWSHSGRFRR